MEKIQEACDERDIHFTPKEIHSAPAVVCASWLQRLTEYSIMEQDVTAVSLISGAGHDAMAFDSVTDIGMLFVRCGAGISHHPDESVTLEDVDAGLHVFHQMLVNLEAYRICN